jgi:8-oxo-dGTP pyrophosphatase MutT (NUDIX family)
MPRMIDEAILAAAAQRLRVALAPRPRPSHALVVDGARLGYFDAARHARLAAFTRVLASRGGDLAFRAALDTPAARTEAFDDIARTLAREGALTAWRDERYAVRTHFAAPAAFHVERAAARYLGIHTWAAHANGLVAGEDGAGLRMWVARRSPHKAIDPSLLDNLVGGGIAAGESPQATLVREAREEAGIERAIAARAVRVSDLYVERHLPDGLQRETLFAYDLSLPARYLPRSEDGEAVEHRLVPLGESARLIAQDAGPDVVTVDASLVILDCLARRLDRPELLRGLVAA